MNRPRWTTLLVRFIAFLISGFYIVSALGWFAATYMTWSGMLGKEATDFWETLNIADRIIRTSQVVLILIASLFFIFMRRIAVRLFLVSFVLSLFSTVFVKKWGISFLGGDSVVTLAIVCLYAYWINRRGFLHPVQEQHLSPVESALRESPCPNGMQTRFSRIVKQMIIASLSSVLILGGLFFIGIRLIQHLEWWSPESLLLLFGVLMICGGIKLLTAIKNP